MEWNDRRRYNSRRKKKSVILEKRNNNNNNNNNNNHKDPSNPEFVNNYQSTSDDLFDEPWI